MTFETLHYENSGGAARITLHRPEHRNAINRALLRELNAALDLAEAAPDCRMVVLQADGDIFCSGMDFDEMAKLADQVDLRTMQERTEEYMLTLKRLATSRRVVVSRVAGAVTAGGVGFVAASDLVLATPKVTFTLTEALWGLLPSNVVPYLVRRVGFQAAFRMTLTAASISAEEAHRLQLVDYLGPDLDELERVIRIRLNRITADTVSELKGFFRKMWIIDTAMEQAAVEETARLGASATVKENIRNFVEARTFPWERRSGR
ncbi:enoyl-CoA hydratase-related protein [Sorangium sp. So ce448]|uniref:enoyl-CoA hydratase-related protein n=1 Tax=Sorangium sp. So ce448 TaxID=3133314 RepID=UPI003F5FE439